MVIRGPVTMFLEQAKYWIINMIRELDDLSYKSDFLLAITDMIGLYFSCDFAHQMSFLFMNCQLMVTDVS